MSIASALVRRPGLWIALAVLTVAGLLVMLQARGPLVDVAAVTDPRAAKG